MQFGWPRTQKPHKGTRLDLTQPLGKGLAWFAPCWEGFGSTLVNDIITDTALKLSSVNVAWKPSSSPRFGSGLALSGDVYAEATLPWFLQLQVPITLVMGYRSIGTPTGNAPLFGLYLNNTASSAYGSAWIQQSSATTIGMFAASGGGISEANSLFTPTSGVDYTIVAVFGPSSYAFYAFPWNGTAPTVAKGSWTAGNATYLSTALIGLGSISGYSRNPNFNAYFAGVYSRALTQSDAYALGSNPWLMFSPTLGVAPFTQPTAGFAISPIAIYNNHPSGESVTFSGTDTTWSGSTTFSVSGVSGATLVMQSVTSTILATATIDTGASTGTLTVSDGTHTRSLPVNPITVMISPTSEPANTSGNITLTLTGMGTSWTSGGTTFTVSGVSGVTKFSQAVTSMTLATVVITPNGNAGTLVVSDGTNSGDFYLTEYFTVSPTTIPQNDSLGFELTLTGTGTDWTDDTVFTVYGVSGAAIAGSPVVSSETSATLFVTTGAATGTLSISDGTYTATASVPALILNPYITKSGQLLMVVATANSLASASVNGNVSIDKSSTLLTTSQPQANWIGKQIIIDGDSSAGTYTIFSGYANSWVLSSEYGSSSDAVDAGATIITPYPLAEVTAVGSSPTVDVQFGGSGSFYQVAISGPYWSLSASTPWAAWQLLCGPVASIVVQDGGSNYNSPSASVSGGGGSGLTLGTPLMTGGVTSYTITNGGSGYIAAPSVTVPAPLISLSGTLTTSSKSVTSISSTTGLVPGMTVNGTGVDGNTIATIVSSTAITLALPAVLNGSQTLKFVGRQAYATSTITSGSVTGISVFVPGSGYNSGSPPAVTIGAPTAGTTATATCSVTNIIHSIPVNDAGSGYTSQPSISISDADGSGAVCVPIMAGVQSSDNVTYTASASWITTSSGTASAASGATVVNSSGSLEPGYGGSYGFGLESDQKIMLQGMNAPAYAVIYYDTGNPHANWLNRAFVQPPAESIVTATPDGRPLTISGTAGSPSNLWIAQPTANFIDNSGFPYPPCTGSSGSLWTFIADEMDPSGGNPTTNVSMTFGTGTGTISSATYTNGNSATGINAQPTIVSGGSGYTDAPLVTFSGGSGSGASGFALINANGVVIQVTVTATGSGYSSAPTVVFTPRDGNGSGASATVTVGTVLVGCTWQWTVVPNAAQAVSPRLLLNFWKTTGGTYAYTLTNEKLFSPATTAAAYPSLPSRTFPDGFDESLTTWLTTPTPRYPAVIRWMGATLTNGFTNVVDPCDLRNPGEFSWYERNSLTGSALATNPTGQRTLSLTTLRTYATSSSGFPSGIVTCIVLTNGGTGYTVAPTVTIAPPTSGTTATATATINATTGLVNGFTITNPGSGYTTAPAVTISAPSSGTTATATATVWDVTWSSPNLYLCNPGTGTSTAVTSNSSWVGYGVGSTGGPYQMTPTSPGQINWAGPASGWFVGEFLTATPHNLKGGQIIELNSGSGYFAVATGSTASQMAQVDGSYFGHDVTITVFPTGANSFVFTSYAPTGTPGLGSPSGMPGDTVNVAGSFTVNYTAVLIIPDQETVPIEVAAQSTGSLPGTDLWINVPYAATDLCVAAIARRCRDTFPKGRKVYVEYGNEHWNGSGATFPATAGQLGIFSNVTTGMTNDATYTLRASQVHAIFYTIFQEEDVNGNTDRGGEIVRLLGSWYTGNMTTQNMITYANAPLDGSSAIQVDAVAVANYEDVTTDATLVTAAASLATHWPTSKAYLATNPWSRAAFLELFRHQIKYKPNQFAAHQGFLNNYTATSTIPALVSYEGGPESLIPSTIQTGEAPAGVWLAQALSLDVYYDPAMYDVETTYYEVCQHGGMQFLNTWELTNGFLGDGDTLYIWPVAAWHGQPFGKGDGSEASNGVDVTNQYWTDTQQSVHGQNVAVRLQAWQDWADAANTAESFTIVPTLIYANDSSGQTLTLYGTNTDWVTDVTTFSVSGVSGVSIKSQAITSTVLATVVVATGSSTGTILISDGVTNAPVVLVVPETFTISPVAIPANHSGNITLTLAGTDTDWGGGTSFTLSGVSGVTAISHNVSSTTEATVVVQTGSGTGSLGISDGTFLATTNVELFSITPSSIFSGEPTGETLTLTGSGTIWDGSTAFSISGVAGSTILSQSVVGPTLADVVVGTGETAGTLTVSDSVYSTTLPVIVGVSAVSPASGSVGVAVSSNITATFLVNMNAASITTATFTLTAGLVSISGGVTYDPDTLTATFSPLENLNYSTFYIAQLTTGVQDANGVALSAPITWTFTTGSTIAPARRFAPFLFRK